MLITKHGQRRGKKRRKLNHSALEREFRKALDNGISLGQTSDKVLRLYLQSIQEKSKYTYTKAKIYNGYVYIYNKNNKSLITMYECPDEIKRRAS